MRKLPAKAAWATIVGVVLVYLAIIPIISALHTKKVVAAHRASKPPPPYPKILVSFGKPSWFVATRLRPYYEYARWCNDTLSESSMQTWEDFKSLP